jgi:hypothetical protein
MLKRRKGRDLTPEEWYQKTMDIPSLTHAQKLKYNAEYKQDLLLQERAKEKSDILEALKVRKQEIQELKQKIATRKVFREIKKQYKISLAEVYNQRKKMIGFIDPLEGKAEAKGEEVKK